MPDTLVKLERKRQGIFRQIEEAEDFRAESIGPATGQHPDLPTFE
jgi:hypothetical protein